MQRKFIFNEIYQLLGIKTYAIFILSFFASIAESFGIMLFLPVLENIGGNQSEDGFVLKLMYRLFEFLHFETNMQNFLMLIAISFAIKGVFTFMSLGYVAYLRGNLFAALRLSLLNSFSDNSFEAILEKSSGFYANAINEQTTRGIQSFYFFTQALCQFISSLLYFLVAFLLAWEFGIIAILVALTIFFGFRYLNKIVYKLSAKSNLISIELTNLVVEGMRNFKYLAATGKVDYFSNHVRKTIGSAKLIQTRFWLFGSFTQSVREPIAVFFILTVVAVQVGYYGHPINPILVSIVLFYRGLNSVIMTQTFWQNSLEFVNGLEIIFEENNRIENHPENDPRKKLKKLHKEDFQSIIFRSVKYEFNDTEILRQINLTIYRNSIVGLIGPSGSGKTTLINLLAGLFRPSDGVVCIDETEMHDVDTHNWKSKIGYVTQEANLFNKSFYENIALKRKLTEQEKLKCHNVIDLVSLGDFIEKSDEGYERYIGEGGSLLSGGQRQRLALARELFKEPKLLILDEATSALDEETEAFILNKILQLKNSMTIIFVSHDPKHVQMFDSCYRITNGVSEKIL